MIPLDATLGFDFINDHMIELANYLETFSRSNMKVLVGAGSALGAIFALVVAAIQAYKMMTMNGKFEILTIARPILFAFILSQWTGVVSIVCTPGKLMENWFREKCEVEKVKIIQLREERKKAAAELTDKLREKAAASMEAKNSSQGPQKDKDYLMELAEHAFENVINTVTGWIVAAEAFFANILQSIIQWIGELVWQIHVYFIFLLKAIYTTVLVMFGPIYIACSILPAWKDTWTQWVGKMVSVSLYGAMAYLVMILAFQLMKYGIQVDTSALTKIANGESGLWNYIVSSLGTTVQTFISMIVGAWALRTVPEIASWAIPSNAIQSANHFIQGTSGNATGKVSKGIV